MLLSSEWADFWKWYHKGAISKTMREQVRDEVYFLREMSELERLKKFVEYLLEEGSELELIENDEGYFYARLDEHYTEKYKEEIELYFYAFRFLIRLHFGRKIEEKVKMETESILVVLYTVDSKGKLRISENRLIGNEEDGFVIKRTTGLSGGKLTDQPEKSILKGKVKRTVTEQAHLEFNSILQKQKDKGYKTVEELGLKGTPSEDTVLEALGTKKTSADGYNKPALAKDLNASKDQEKVVNNDSWYASYKLDGIRVLIHLEDDKLIFKSRGGKVFSGVTERFKNDPFLKKWIKEHKCEIDGEFYTHGVNLEIISGACRLDDYDPLRHDHIKLFIFDIADEYRTTSERIDTLDIMRDEDYDRSKIEVLQHYLIDSWDELTELHNKALAEGFEGTIIRKVGELYQFGKRNAAMWKRKDFQDEEFEVIGYAEGLRPTEDMVFKLKTKDGKEFEAKPFGDRALKQQYVENIEQLIGQFGTVKFFYYTADGVPFLPSFKCFRPMVYDKVLI